MRTGDLRRVLGMAASAGLVTALGCGSVMKATSGHMSADKAAKYSQLSPSQFVKTRFYTEERSSVGDALETPLKMNAYRPIVSPDGAIVELPAYYNQVNYYQITRPEQNLQVYCQRRGGQWALVRPYDRAPIPETERDLAAENPETRDELFLRLHAQASPSGYTPAGLTGAEGGAANGASEAAQNNAKFDGLDPGLRVAKREGAFGEFKCSSPQDTWYAWVIPGRIFPGSPDPMVRLIIRAASAAEVASWKQADDYKREIAHEQEDARRAVDAERVRTLRLRGQAMIDRSEIGSRLCEDIQVGASPAVVSAFLEAVRGENLQLRVNNVVSPDGATIFTLKGPIDGILYLGGNVVWSQRGSWRACD